MSTRQEKLTSYQRIINDTFPDLKILSSQLNDQGQNNDVLVVNEEWIFRFPKYAHAIDQLRVETSILKGIQGYLSLPTPVPSFTSLGTGEVGQAFMGYHIIPGQPLWRPTFKALTEERTLTRIAGQVATFLKELHSVPYAEALNCELPIQDTRGKCADIYTRMRDMLFHHMRPDAQAWTVDHFEAFLDNDDNFAYSPVLKHGDFGTSNILFDETTQTVTGIIDFGGSGVGDPAYDFAGLLSCYGERFIQRCCDTYPGLDSILPRVRFYRGTFALLEALFGAENDDLKAFESGIAAYV